MPSTVPRSSIEIVGHMPSGLRETRDAVRTQDGPNWIWVGHQPICRQGLNQRICQRYRRALACTDGEGLERGNGTQPPSSSIPDGGLEPKLVQHKRIGRLGDRTDRHLNVLVHSKRLEVVGRG